jgi:abortive infection bacteriophage resistance protein
MTIYNKSFLTIDKQIGLFEERGLKIGDKKRAEFFLKHISYYHLSIYTKALQNKDNSFKNDSNFEDIIVLYNFDKKLRLLLLDVLERIEMSFKCVLAYEITKYKDDNFWYANENNFCNGKDDIEKLLDDVRASKEIYIQHYYRSYSKPMYPPAWIFFESLTFGNCSRLARNLHDM